MQNDFCTGGALAVTDGEKIIEYINGAQEEFETIVLTQDWHPQEHSSFASNHGAEPYSNIEMEYGTQILWPDHCIQGTNGAEFHEKLEWTKAELVLRKGYRKAIDSYSAFFENDRKTPTGLGGALQERGITSLMMVGLATDFCVAFSALDAAALGFDCTVVMDCCRAIDLDNSLANMSSRMKDQGIAFSNSRDLTF